MNKSKIPTFIAGALTGAIFAISVGATAQPLKGDDGFLTTILYAISQLAVDTEKNAAKIVSLSERLDDLEEKFEIPEKP